MAKHGSADLIIEFDATPGGTLTDMTQYIDEINDVEVEAVMEEGSHSFGAAWFEELATGLRKGNAVTMGGWYDSTASVTGPQAVFGTVAASPAEASRTLKITWGAGKSTTAETYIQKYARKAQRGRLTRFSVTVKPTGTIGEA